MRTTLTIDEDLALQIQRIRREKGLSLKQTINQLLRSGLEADAAEPASLRYRSKASDLGLRAGFDATKLNQAVDDLETS